MYCSLRPFVNIFLLLKSSEAATQRDKTGKGVLNGFVAYTELEIK